MFGGLGGIQQVFINYPGRFQRVLGVAHHREPLASTNMPSFLGRPTPSEGWTFFSLGTLHSAVLATTPLAGCDAHTLSLMVRLTILVIYHSVEEALRDNGSAQRNDLLESVLGRTDTVLEKLNRVLSKIESGKQ